MRQQQVGVLLVVVLVFAAASIKYGLQEPSGDAAAWIHAGLLPKAAAAGRAAAHLQLPAGHDSHVLQPTAAQPAGFPTHRPWTIAHRGASGLLPEHTLAAYQLAITQGADFIECDVILTRDLAPICRHDPDLNLTTNAASLFPDRVNTYTIDGKQHTGIFAADLTLAEVKQLRAKQRWPFRGHQHDNKYSIPTLYDFLDVVAAAHRVVGIYPETKHPTWHASLPWVAAANTSVQEIVLQALQVRGYTGPYGSAAWLSAPVFIQSFEETSLKQLAAASDIPLVLLLGGWEGFRAPDTGMTHEEMTTLQHLQQVATYAAGVGPWKSTLYSSSSAAAAQVERHGSGSSKEHPDGPLETHGQHTASKKRSGSSNSRSKGSSRSGSSRRSGNSSSSPASRWWAQSSTNHTTTPVPAARQRQHQSKHHRHQQQQEQGAVDLPDSERNPATGLHSTGFAARLRAAGLQVHPYTLRDEEHFVPAGAKGGVRAEMEQLFLHEKVHGAFSDFPGTMHAWLSDMFA